MAANGFDDDQTRSFTNLAAGTIVSHYKIISKIGAGGMGEVYLAEDTGLNRKVALKFLSPHLCQDADCRTRFKREAQAAAKLSHPNIVTIFDVSEFQERPFFSMELVEGRSLREVIKQGKLTVAEAISLTLQLCEGLQEAHEAGITHRDIKPSNVIVDKKGRVKILDFGLAAIKGTDRLTKTGSTLGTVDYMSPEQAEGKEVDQRSDLFSLGVVLYEMIAGRLPFKGGTEVATMNSIINDVPEPLSRYKSGVSDELQRIVSKALTKGTDRRYQHIEELLADLRSEKEGQSGKIESIQKSKSLNRKQLMFIGMIAIVLATAIAAVFVSMFQRDSRTILQLNRKQLTFDGDAYFARISPDGQHLAYVRSGGREQRVLVQDLSGGLPIEIFRVKWILDIAWTPSSDELLIGAISDSEQITLLLPRSGGQHRRYPPAAGFNGFAWSPDGERFAAASSFLGTIELVEKISGSIASIPLGGVLTNSPQSVDWSPEGNLLVIQGGTSTGMQLWTFRLQDGKQRKILDSTEARRPRWSPGGNALYYLEPREEKLSDLMKMQIDPETGAARSAPKLLISGIQTGEDYSITADGRKMVYTQDVSSSNLWVIDLAGQEPNPDYRQITSGTAGVRFPSPSPDGSRLVFARNVGEDPQIFTIPVRGGNPQQITFNQRRNSMPCWSPDGNYIAYISVGEGIARVEVVQSNGGPPRVFSDIDLDPDTPGAISWSPGERILFGGGFGYKMLDPSDGRITPLEFSDTIPRVAWQAHYLPGGKRIAVCLGQPQPQNRNQTQNFFPQIEIVSLDDSMPSTVLSQMFYDIIGWSPDGKWLYRTDSEDGIVSVVRFNIENAKTEKVLTIPIEHVSDVAMFPDCGRFACVAVKSQTDIWLVENFDPDVK